MEFPMELATRETHLIATRNLSTFTESLNAISEVGDEGGMVGIPEMWNPKGSLWKNNPKNATLMRC